MILGTEMEFGLTWGERAPQARLAAGFYGQVGLGDLATVQHLNDKLGWLLCGGKLYIDQSSYLEFAGPECASIRDVVLYEKAGERIAWQIASQSLGDILQNMNLLKTSGDSFKPNWTKACHENYLIPKQLFSHFWASNEFPLTKLYLAFLVTRPIIAGAGWIFLQNEWPLFSISQRAHHIVSTVSEGTTSQRALINLRDRSYASHDWSRLHVIVGDLNRCDWSSFLKVGTTAIVLEFLAERFNSGEVWDECARPLREAQITNPHGALQLVSMDLSTKSKIPQFKGRVESAWQMQDLFCETLSRWYESYRKERYGPNPEYELVFAKWRETLDALNRDPRELSGTLDWPTRLTAVESILEEYGVSWTEVEQGGAPEEVIMALASFDHRYSSLNPAVSIFEEALRENAISRIVSEEEIRKAMSRPPKHTRAFCRGNAVRRAIKHIYGNRRVNPLAAMQSTALLYGSAMNWERILFRIQNKTFEIRMPEPWNEYREGLQLLMKFINMLPKEVIRP